MAARSIRTASAPVAGSCLAVVRVTPQVFISRFRCPSEAAARGLVNSLLVDGLYPELHDPPLPDQPWEVAVPVEVVATEANLAELRAVMGETAERFAVSFEGCDRDR